MLKKVLEVLAVVIALGYAVVTFCMWRDLKHNFTVDERAWVAAIAISDAPRIDKPFDVVVRIRNTGKTFAKETGVVDAAEPLLQDQSPDFAGELSRKPTSVTVLAPNGDFVSTIHVRLPDDKQTLSKPGLDAMIGELKSERMRLVIHGRITYKDIFDSPHWTTFCFNLGPSLHYESCEMHNDAD
jgi:hypothetical protein